MKVKKDPFVIAIINAEQSEYFTGENVLQWEVLKTLWTDVSKFVKASASPKVVW